MTRSMGAVGRDSSTRYAGRFVNEQCRPKGRDDASSAFWCLQNMKADRSCSAGEVGGRGPPRPDFGPRRVLLCRCSFGRLPFTWPVVVRASYSDQVHRGYDSIGLSDINVRVGEDVRHGCRRTTFREPPHGRKDADRLGWSRQGSCPHRSGAGRCGGQTIRRRGGGANAGGQIGDGSRAGAGLRGWIQDLAPTGRPRTYADVISSPAVSGMGCQCWRGLVCKGGNRVRFIRVATGAVGSGRDGSLRSKSGAYGSRCARTMLQRRAMSVVGSGVWASTQDERSRSRR